MLNAIRLHVLVVIRVFVLVKTWRIQITDVSLKIVGGQFGEHLGWNAVATLFSVHWNIFFIVHCTRYFAYIYNTIPFHEIDTIWSSKKSFNQFWQIERAKSSWMLSGKIYLGKLFDIVHVCNWTYFCMSVHILDCLNLAHHCQCDLCKNRSACQQCCKCQKLCPLANLDLPPPPPLPSDA